MDSHIWDFWWHDLSQLNEWDRRDMWWKNESDEAGDPIDTKTWLAPFNQMLWKFQIFAKVESSRSL